MELGQSRASCQSLADHHSNRLERRRGTVELLVAQLANLELAVEMMLAQLEDLQSASGRNFSG